ncbi:hypothetical protein Tco_0544979 [Tanacetum coccineum]
MIAGKECLQVLIRIDYEDSMRYGMNRPEDKLEKGFWECLRIMFEEPLSTDSIWSELGQQKIIVGDIMLL